MLTKARTTDTATKRKFDSFSVPERPPNRLDDRPWLHFENINKGNYWFAKTWGLVGLYTVIWYCSAIVTITTTKEIVNRLKLPFLLCSVQFLFASLLSFSYLRLTRKVRTAPAIIDPLVLRVAATYTLGFVSTNLAFSRGM